MEGVVVVGGGVYGCEVALMQARSGHDVTLVESGSELVGRASLVNQARLHAGYHYPRSLLTALRSRVNVPRFMAEYPDCVHDGFDHYYAVSRLHSQVTADQFRTFSERIGASLDPAPPEIVRLFDPRMIAGVWKVRECAFDAVRLRADLAARLGAAGVKVLAGTQAERVVADGSDLAVEIRHGVERDRLRGRRVYNCTYSRLNQLLAASGLDIVPLKHELTEMALVEVPPVLNNIAITVMCGPFFSMMPFPSRGLHTLSHVRYTPHFSWEDRPGADQRDPGAVLDQYQRRSSFLNMVKDAARYVPVLAEVRQADSFWEVKTVLPQSEASDSRPILVSRSPRMPGLVSILGSKIDNVFEIEAVA
jgi:glycine/D-amino acid oxidase-like deaminating enzyme